MALGSCCKARGFSVLHLIYKPTAVFLESQVNSEGNALTDFLDDGRVSLLQNS